MRRRVFLGALPGLMAAACSESGRGLTTLVEGARWPDAEMPELQSGVTRKLAAGTTSLVNFWATWCPPCRAEMASLNQLFLDFRGRGLAVEAASIDEDVHLVREFLLKVPLAFPILLDQGGHLAKERFRVSVFPTSFLVDRSRVVRAVWVGERDWSDGPVRAAIERVLAS